MTGHATAQGPTYPPDICDHCHHGRADGVRVGWSPDRLVWEACERNNEEGDDHV